jgi:hypothetical protein
VAHDTGGCQAGQPEDACLSLNVECTTSTGFPGVCATTTGNAGYCLTPNIGGGCRQDIDCQAEFGPRAACIKCALADGTVCVGPDDVV